jgi:hypothetical protein
VTQLETFPDSGRFAPEDPTQTYRELIFGDYRVIYRPVEQPAKPVCSNRLLCVPMAAPQPERRFAISSRTAGTSSMGTPIAVCVVAS